MFPASNLARNVWLGRNSNKKKKNVFIPAGVKRPQYKRKRWGGGMQGRRAYIERP